MICRTVLWVLEPKPLSQPAACRLVPFLALERRHCTLAQASWDAVGSVLGQDMGLSWQEHRKQEQTPCVARGCLLSLGYLQRLLSFQACNLLSVRKISKRGDGMCSCVGCTRGKSPFPPSCSATTLDPTELPSPEASPPRPSVHIIWELISSVGMF